MSELKTLPECIKDAARPLANTYPESYAAICESLQFMQTRLDQLQYENARLRAQLEVNYVK